MNELKTRLRRAVFVARQQPGHVLAMLWFSFLAGMDPATGIGVAHVVALALAASLAIHQTLLERALRSDGAGSDDRQS
jgi:hypothetical protein